MVAVLVALEWTFRFDFSLGIVYILPMMFAAAVLNRWQILLAAIFCAYTRGLFITGETPLEEVLRFAMATIAYTGCGLFIYQISESRRVVMTHYTRLRMEQQLRRSAQEQLRLMVESSPAGIFTIDNDGRILAANRAAELMLQSINLVGKAIRDFVPLFDNALNLPEEIGNISTSATGWAARRGDGTMFPVSMWFSIYGEGRHRRLAAIVVDKSNEIRERERAQFQQLANHDRILTGAVSHEIRNLCSAILVVASNLERNNKLSSDADFIAMKNLLKALKELASVDVRKKTNTDTTAVKLQDVGEEMRLFVGQDWQDIGGRFCWNVSNELPMVSINRQNTLQALLNLAQNSLRAVADSSVREMVIDGRVEDEAVVLRVCDTGPGMESTEHLFQPFRPGAEGSGLGLYVSRAMVESFGGRLTYVPTETGCCFELMLPIAVQSEHEFDEAELG